MECQLRKWRLEDAEDLAKALNNKHILDNLRDGLPYPYAKEDAKSFIKAMHEADENVTYAFAITVDDKAVGSIGVFRKENIHKYTAEIGYYVSESYWGNGIGKRAVGLMCQYIFEHTDIMRIFAEPFANNRTSCHVLEKSGFTYEGTLRKNAVKNGRVLDMKMYSLVKED